MMLQGGASGPRTLASLVRAWEERGTALPVAVVVSIFDDLLEQAGHRPDPSQDLKLDDVFIDDRGVAHVGLENDTGDLSSVAPLLAEALGEGLDHDIVPPAARSLLERLADPDERPADSEQLRLWLRDALGSPAPRDEVLACLEATGDASVLSTPPLAEESSTFAADALGERPAPVSETPPPARAHVTDVEPRAQQLSLSLPVSEPVPAAKTATMRPRTDAPEPVPSFLLEPEAAGGAPEEADLHEVPTLVPAQRDSAPPQRPKEASLPPAPIPRWLSPAAEVSKEAPSQSREPVSVAVSEPVAIAVSEPATGPTASEASSGVASAEEPVLPADALELVAPDDETEVVSPFALPPRGVARRLLQEALSSRPVVRHAVPSNDKPVSVPVAPAARRNATPTGRAKDTIVVPNRGIQWLGWTVLATAGALFAYYYFIAV